MSWQVWFAGLGAVAGLMVLTWAASLVRRDASLVDRVWGLGFVVAAWVYAALGDGPDTRGWWAAAGSTLMTVLIVKVSGVALTDQSMRESRREGYDTYVRRTNAFIPGPRRTA